MKLFIRQITWLVLYHSIVFAFIALCLVMGLLSNKFFTLPNWLNILNNLSVSGIVALAAGVVIIAGGIDLSFGSILGCCAIVSAWLQPHNAFMAIAAALLLGTLLGTVNGVMVAKCEANPLIVTLGTQWLFFSVLFIVTQGNLVQGNDENFFHLIGQGRLGGIPVPIYILLGSVILMWWITTKTVIGKYIYAHGSNKLGLQYAGVNASSVYLFTFTLMGFLIGIAAIVLSSRLIGVRPNEGNRYLLNVLTAVLLSGVSLSGGIGSVFHILIAVLVLGVIDNGMVLLAVEYKYQQMIRGVIFVLAVIYNNMTLKKLHSLRLMKE